MSYIGQQTNQQSLNGIIDLTDGTISIVDGNISNVEQLSMNGEINMNTNKIINLKDGENAGDAVNKAQLDAISINLNDYVRRDGTNSMTGNLNLNSNRVTNVATATAGTDATNKNYVDTQTNNANYLLRNGTLAMTGNLNLNSNRIINVATATTGTDAVNKSQLDLKADKTYTDTQLALKANITYVDSQDNLKVGKAGDTMTGALNMNSTNKIINVAEPTNDKDVATKNYVDTHSINNNYVKKVGDTMTGNLNMNSTNKIINLTNGTNSGDAVNKSQLDLKADKTYTDTQLALKADKTYTDTQLALKANITYVDSQDNLKVNKAGDTMTGVLTIDKDAFDFQSQSIVVSSYSLTSGNTIFEYLTFTGTSGLTVYVPHLSSSDNSMVNKIVYISFLNASSFSIMSATTNNITITRPDVGGFVSTSLGLTLNDVPSRIIRFIGNSIVGNYTLYKVAQLPQSLDQLTIKSNVGENANSEFTGIRFLNTNTDAGFIRVATDKPHNNSTMCFRTRQNNSIITPLEIGSNVNASNPYLVNNVNICSVGYNQTWQILTGSIGIFHFLFRYKDTWYENTTGRPIVVNANFTGNNSAAVSEFGLEVSTSASSSGIFADKDYTNNDSNEFKLRGIIPSSGQVWYRVVKISGGNTTWDVKYWSELR